MYLVKCPVYEVQQADCSMWDRSRPSVFWCADTDRRIADVNGQQILTSYM